MFMVNSVGDTLTLYWQVPRTTCEEPVLSENNAR
jgi:hypothetical protein